VKFINVLDILFISENFNKIFELLKKGGLMVVPSGPGLATIGKDIRYTLAVQNADFAIADSSYMVLLLKIIKRVKIDKFSGYDFLKHFFNEHFKKNDIFLIDPNNKESKINNMYLNEIGIPIQMSYHYVAPIYGENKIYDKDLLEKISSLKEKPKYIIINLGSGIQEPLGFFLKSNLDFKPGIICTGAAISFFTGSQAKITPFIDNYGLGWFWRCITSPKLFIPRYLKAFKLFFLILKTKVKILQ
jgi:N-acetylglucosaminyldiphosphoundecaprenol N-acetyl-beta-D-mannosaminyltransferase